MRPKKTILCVDDDENMLNVRQLVLETRGHYTVLTARSGAEALRILAAYAPGEIFLILCDLVMPGMNGVEVIAAAVKMHPGLPSLLVSGSVIEPKTWHVADVFLPKGACSPAEVLERVRVLVARKRGPKRFVPPTVEHLAA